MDDSQDRSAQLPAIAKQRPWDTETMVPLPADAGFTPQEHWAWARIIRGLTANMSLFPSDAAAQIAGKEGSDDGRGDDPKNAENWPAHRTLSARFLGAILFLDPWATAAARPFVRIRCARFVGGVDWENENYEGEIGLQRCVFDEDVIWRGLRVGKLVNLSGSRMQGRLWADRLTIEGGLFCRDGFSAKSDVRMLGARIGHVEFSGATLEGALEADGMVVGGDLFLREGFSAEGDIRLLGAVVDGDLAFNGAVLNGVLEGDRLVVKGGLFCSTGLVAKKAIRLLGARVGGSASFVGATFEDLISADGLKVEGSLFLRDVKKLSGADFLGATIEGELQLSQSAIDGEVDLTGADIKGDINLAFAADVGPKWGEKARLVLRNARAGAFAGGLGALRRGRGFVPCDLAGFSYNRIGGIGAGAVGSTLATAKGPHLRAWLKQCRPHDHFDPAPYHTLAKALRDAGRSDRAADVRNALGNYELVAKGTPLAQRFMLALSWLFIGYGERNHRAVIAFVLLGLIATYVGYWQDMISLPAGSPAGWEDLRAWLSWAGFGFGNSIPLVTLDPAHATFLQDHFCVEPGPLKCMRADVPFGLTGFFYVTKVVGFIILSYLAAGLSGLAQHKE